MKLSWVMPQSVDFVLITTNSMEVVWYYIKWFYTVLIIKANE